MTLNMKRNDFILAGTAFAVAIVWLLVLQFGQQKGGVVCVYVDGKLTGTYSLEEEQSILINGIDGGTNVLTIKDEHATMTEASCPDKQCVYQRAVSKSGETIVCLPNRVVIKVDGGLAMEYDAVTN